MEYIAYKRFNEMSMSGLVDIPVGAKLTCENSIIKYNGADICANTSENAHTYFMRNDDGHGMERGNIINAIFDLLKRPDTDDSDIYDRRWEKVINDPKCQAFSRAGHDTWIWNHAFYNTTIEILSYIYNLIAGVTV